jgi:hypothetical protein
VDLDWARGVWGLGSGERGKVLEPGEVETFLPFVSGSSARFGRHQLVEWTSAPAGVSMPVQTPEVPPILTWISSNLLGESDATWLSTRKTITIASKPTYSSTSYILEYLVM